MSSMILLLSLAINVICPKTLAASVFVAGAEQSGPIVDLGYSLHQASINHTAGYFNFSNVRYARAPTGELRFAPPQPPLPERSVVQDGQTGRICPQVTTSNTKKDSPRAKFLRTYIESGGNQTAAFGALESSTSSSAPSGGQSSQPSLPTDPRIVEDCLFLDVIVPQTAFNRKHLSSSQAPLTSRGAPVMVWTHGGGYRKGEKDQIPSPAGLISRATEPIIFVTIDYRHGVFGWLAGPSFQEQGGTANAGLYDQRAALNWVQKYIHLFGGDPERVTAAGSSAGAGMTLHQLTAFGGRERAPFQQVFLESGAFLKSGSVSNQQLESHFEQVLKGANATSLAELRVKDFEALAIANQVSTANDHGPSSWSPAVDGNIVPALPDLLLSRGHFAKNVRGVFAGYNTNDGLTFVSPVALLSGLSRFLQGAFPDASAAFFNELEYDLYPNVTVHNATSSTTQRLRYHDSVSRLAQIINDYGFTSNVYNVLKAFGFDKSYSYGLHGEQVPYTFYNDSPREENYDEGEINTLVADQFMKYVANFVVRGNPNAKDLPYLSPYGANGTVLRIANYSVAPEVGPLPSERDAYWAKALYY